MTEDSTGLIWLGMTSEAIPAGTTMVVLTSIASTAVALAIYVWVMFPALTTLVGIEMTATELVVSITVSVVVTVPMAQMVVMIATIPHETTMIETQEAVATTIIVAMIQKEVREETTTLATIMIEVREEITKLATIMLEVRGEISKLATIMIEVRGVESTIVAIISQRHQHRSVLQEEMTHQAVQAQARVARIIMVEEVAWTIVVANATRQTQVEKLLLATNAEVVVETQAKLQAVANAQHQ